MSSIFSDILLKLIVVIALALFFLVTAFISFAVKIVPENKRVVIMRFGKFLGSRGPGIVTIIPIIDFAIWVDLQQTYCYKYNNLLTSDNQKMSCAITLEGKVIDPEKSVLNVPNLENALSKVIETEMMDIARSKNSHELTQRRNWLEGRLKDVLYRSSKSWGFEVSKLVIDDIQHTPA
jgi:regulator of protease activity HflC (stomatin/prohibitin superfamily)